ncbi:MAG: hypothetical protein OEM82_12890 [Acidobacteriota bacterium]|nr:hypothetical protein [Acidobacteriota bacterium]
MAVPRIESEAIELFEKRLNEHPTIKRKGANNPYTSVNGHMFSHVNKAGEVGLRLSKEDREAFIEKHGTGPMESYGAVMREYVVVPVSVLKSKKSFLGYLDKSFAYVSSLKPKPTTKKKS